MAVPGVLTLLELDARIAGIVRGVGAESFRSVWPAVAQMAVSDVKKNIAEGHSWDGRPFVPLAHGRPGGGAGGKPLRDTGLLLGSITGRPNADGVTVGTNRPDAPLHQFGGVVRPTKAKFLAIPLTVAAKRAGSPRNFPAAAWQFIPTRTGGWLMVAARPQSAGERRRGVRPVREAQYVLVDEVTIPARPFMGFSPGLVHRVGQLIVDQALRTVGGALGLAGGGNR